MKYQSYTLFNKYLGEDYSEVGQLMIGEEGAFGRQCLISIKGQSFEFALTFEELEALEEQLAEP